MWCGKEEALASSDVNPLCGVECVFLCVMYGDGFCEKKRLMGGVDDSILVAAVSQPPRRQQLKVKRQRQARTCFCLCSSSPCHVVLCCLSPVIIAWGLVLPVVNHDNTTHLFSFFFLLYFFFKKTRNALVFMALCGLHVLVSTIPEAISVFFWNGVYSGTLVNKIVIYK
jgi:hypothetical protein